MSQPVVSIIIDNYNYAQFLVDAIRSALHQTYENTEIIVVDDGSIDDSRDIIARFGACIKPVLKENGGMGSAYNTGFTESKGDYILLLDSDDVLLPDTVEDAIKLFSAPDVVKVQWPLWEINARGERTGRILPKQSLDEGDFRQITIQQGPDCYSSAPTSGNAWSRRFLEAVLPMPESEFRQHADTYLYTLAPIYGKIRSTAQPLASYRVHGDNDYAGKSSDEKNRRNLEIFHHRCIVLSQHLSRMGIIVDADGWKERSPYYAWMRQMRATCEELKQAIPAGATFILVDQGELGDAWGAGEVIDGRHALPFLEQEGVYWGPPPDDATAIAELERMRESGAAFVAVAWPAFWWLDYYTGLRDHLGRSFTCLLRNDRVVVFDLRHPKEQGCG